jgi:hypothetical protein
LVEELTSGASVTTRAAASGAERVRSSRVRPSAAWVVAWPPGVRPMSVGISGTAVGVTGSRRSRSAISTHNRPAGVSSANRTQGAAGSVPELFASSPNWSAVSCEEWFCGCPSEASP